MVKGTFLRKENRRESWKRQKEKHKNRKRTTKDSRRTTENRRRKKKSGIHIRQWKIHRVPDQEQGGSGIADRVEWDEDGRVCHIRDVIGPDEYKQRVTDNTYTNYMARHNLRLAVQIAERLEKEDPEYLVADILPILHIL